MDTGAEARHRAKVYCLNEDGQWDDRGTGHAAVQYMPVNTAWSQAWSNSCPFLALSIPWPARQPRPSRAACPAVVPWLSCTCSQPQAEPAGACGAWQAEEAAFIVVLSEEDGASHLLQARVLMEDIYQRQQGGPLPLALARSAPTRARPTRWPLPEAEPFV